MCVGGYVRYVVVSLRVDYFVSAFTYYSYSIK
jgi:hypothetical protein